jgi:folate-binding protein YgfZ
MKRTCIRGAEILIGAGYTLALEDLPIARRALRAPCRDMARAPYRGAARGQGSTMAEAFILWPEGRGLVRIAGPDARAFLQGIVSNDVYKVSSARAVYAALLTPQGKYLHDFFIAELDGALFLDCELARRDDLVRRLGRFKLRANATVEPAAADRRVALIYGAEALSVLGLPHERGAAQPFAGGVAYTDPRVAEIGARAILPPAPADLPAALHPGSAEAYEQLRLRLGLPDGSRDLEIEKSLLLENGFAELGGVDWDKGCYMGQELTARTHYRALVKKRLVPVVVEGPLPEPGTPVVAEGVEVGVMRSGSGSRGLALLKREAIAEPRALTAGGAKLTPAPPAWHPA